MARKNISPGPAVKGRKLDIKNFEKLSSSPLRPKRH